MSKSQSELPKLSEAEEPFRGFKNKDYFDRSGMAVELFIGNDEEVTMLEIAQHLHVNTAFVLNALKLYFSAQKAPLDEFSTVADVSDISELIQEIKQQEAA